MENILINYSYILYVISIVLLVLPVLCLVINPKKLFSLYAISIIANLPLLINFYFSFSYEIYLSIVILIYLCFLFYLNYHLKYYTNKQSIILFISILSIILINIITSLFHFNHIAIKQYIYVFVSNLFIYIIFRYFLNDDNNINMLVKAIFIGGVFLSLSIIFEAFYSFYWLGVMRSRYGGLYIDPNVSALVLNLCFLLSFYKRKFYNNFNIIFRYFFRLIILLGIVFTASRSGFIALTFIFIYLLGYYIIIEKAFYKPLLTIMVITFLFFIFKDLVSMQLLRLLEIVELNRFSQLFSLVPNLNKDFTDINKPPPISFDEPSSGRWQLLYNTIHVIKIHFKLGVGIGNLPKYIDPLYLMNSHNLWLQLIGESGLLMIAALLFFGIYLLIYTFSKKFTVKYILVGCLMVVFIDSFFNHNLLNMNLIWLFIALYISCYTLSVPKQIRIYLENRFSFKVKTKQFLNQNDLENKEYLYTYTIITPTYNRANYLTRLYNSLLQQNRYDFEWIIIDDGSLDNTLEIVNKIINISPFKVKYLYQRNQGKHVALNKGISNAKGKYTVVVDSDDYLTIDALNLLSIRFYQSSQINYRICGVGGLKANFDSKPINTFKSHNDYIIASNIERKKIKLKGDMQEAFYTDVLKEYPFKQFTDELFLPERIVWDQIASDNYNVLWFKNIITIIEYLPDGLTHQDSEIYLKNINGYSLFISNFKYINYSRVFRIYHIGSFTNNVRKYYNLSFNEVSNLIEIRPIEIYFSSIIHKVLQKCLIKK